MEYNEWMEVQSNYPPKPTVFRSHTWDMIDQHLKEQC
jgi:hypothetical protein